MEDELERRWGLWVRWRVSEVEAARGRSVDPVSVGRERGAERGAARLLPADCCAKKRARVASTAASVDAGYSLFVGDEKDWCGRRWLPPAAVAVVVFASLFRNVPLGPAGDECCWYGYCCCC